MNPDPLSALLNEIQNRRAGVFPPDELELAYQRRLLEEENRSGYRQGPHRVTLDPTWSLVEAREPTDTDRFPPLKFDLDQPQDGWHAVCWCGHSKRLGLDDNVNVRCSGRGIVSK